MSNIYKGEFQDYEGNVVYPHTSADVVFATDGQTIQKKLNDAEIDYTDVKAQLTSGEHEFRFGITADGEYGYHKEVEGADTVVPFKSDAELLAYGCTNMYKYSGIGITGFLTEEGSKYFSESSVLSNTDTNQTTFTAKKDKKIKVLFMSRLSGNDTQGNASMGSSTQKYNFILYKNNTAVKQTNTTTGNFIWEIELNAGDTIRFAQTCSDVRYAAIGAFVIY